MLSSRFCDLLFAVGCRLVLLWSFAACFVFFVVRGFLTVSSVGGRRKKTVVEELDFFLVWRDEVSCSVSVLKIFFCQQRLFFRLIALRFLSLWCQCATF